MITAIIRNKDNTLVLDFPCDIYSVYTKLQSIGIAKSPKQIPLTDNEDEDIGVKLYSESDFGQHLLLTLMMVLSALPDIEIVCTDSSECFDDNKAYLTARLEAEDNGRVKKLIKKDIDFLDTIQVEMAAARQFFFVARLKGQKEKQVFETANRIESKISGEGFEVHRLKKPEIKRILALYFDASMQGDTMPNIDGEQYFQI